MQPVASRRSLNWLQRCVSTEAGLRNRDIVLPESRLEWRASNRDIRAMAQTATAVEPTCDRILRYPDGVVRTIRYPLAQLQHQSPDCTHMSDTGSSDWHICSENDSGCTFPPTFDDECRLPGAAPVEHLWGRAAPRQQDISPPRMPAPKEEFGQLPSSPAALLELLSSDKYRREQQAHAERIRSSYVIMHGCPWVAHRPLLTVAVPQGGKEARSAYTLPVAVQQEGQLQELAKLLKAPNLAGAMTHRHMQDGIIVFADTGAATRFRDNLQAAGSLAAALTEVDSHALFRAAADACTVVVLVGPSKPEQVTETPSSLDKQTDSGQHGTGAAADIYVPTPAELAASLRGPSPMQDW